MSLGLPSAASQGPGPALAALAGRLARPGLLAVLMAAAFTLATLYFDRTQAFEPGAIRFLDPDDAMRLAQVRAFLAGGGWFDPLIGSIGEAPGLPSHWSRLLDLPIAGMILALAPVLGAAGAEHAALLLWPKLVLLLFVALFIRQLMRETSWEAGLALAAMLWMSLFAIIQFQLTRIDHHNVQNACAALAFVLATAPRASGRSALAAGLVAGLGLAVGYEALPAIGLLAGLLALASPLGDDRRRIAEGFAAGLASALALAFAATVAPDRWLAVPCDALGLNVVAGAGVGALGLLTAGRARGAALRLAAIAGAGAAALAVFAAVEPACLAGPFAKVDPAMGPIWLDLVQEARPLHGLGATKPALAVGIGLSLLLCLAVQAAAAWQERSVSNGIRLALLLLLTALAFRYLKLIPYAQLLGLYCLARAAFALRWPSAAITPRAAAMLLLLLATPIPLLVAASTVLTDKPDADSGKRCVAERDFAALAALPAARILPQPDLGGFLALMAHHRVLIGNYHRLDAEIMRAHAVLSAPAAEALPLLAAWRIDVVAHCAGRRFYGGRTPEGSLARAVERGEDLPAFLRPIDMGPDTDVRAYRVVRP